MRRKNLLLVTFFLSIPAITQATDRLLPGDFVEFHNMNTNRDLNGKLGLLKSEIDHDKAVVVYLPDFHHLQGEDYRVEDAPKLLGSRTVKVKTARLRRVVDPTLSPVEGSEPQGTFWVLFATVISGVNRWVAFYFPQWVEGEESDEESEAEESDEESDAENHSQGRDKALSAIANHVVEGHFKLVNRLPELTSESAATVEVIFAETIRKYGREGFDDLKARISQIIPNALAAGRIGRGPDSPVVVIGSNRVSPDQYAIKQLEPLFDQFLPKGELRRLGGLEVERSYLNGCLAVPLPGNAEDPERIVVVCLVPSTEWSEEAVETTVPKDCLLKLQAPLDSGPIDRGEVRRVDEEVRHVHIFCRGKAAVLQHRRGLDRERVSSAPAAYPYLLLFSAHIYQKFGVDGLIALKKELLDYGNSFYKMADLLAQALGLKPEVPDTRRLERDFDEIFAKITESE